jgi:hypothetical protein
MELPVYYEACSPGLRKRVREEYVRRQGGKCHFCGEPLDGEPIAQVRNRRIYERMFPTGFFKNPIHLHHDHNTGLTKGAVHARCNAYLWQYRGQ